MNQMNLAYICNCTLTPNPNFDHGVKRNLHISYIEITNEIMCFEKWTVALLNAQLFLYSETQVWKCIRIASFSFFLS